MIKEAALVLACCVQKLESTEVNFIFLAETRKRGDIKKKFAVREQRNSWKSNYQCRCINNSPEECRTGAELGSVSQIKVCLELLKALHFPSLSPLFLSRRRGGHLERIKALRTLDLPRAAGWMGGPLWTPFSSRAQPHLINGGSLTRTVHTHIHTHSLKSQLLDGVQCENWDTWTRVPLTAVGYEVLTRLTGGPKHRENNSLQIKGGELRDT